MKCAIFFALLAFTSATPLMGWRNVEPYGPQEFWNDQDASHDNTRARVIQEAIQQFNQYDHMWTELMDRRELPQTYQMPMRTLETPLEQGYEAFHHLSGMPIEMHQVPLEQTHETYRHVSGMPMNTLEHIYQQFPEMHGIPFAHSSEASHYFSQVPVAGVASLEHYYGNMENVHQQDDVAHHQYGTVEGRPSDYHDTSRRISMQYFNSRLQKFVEEHSEQEVQNLIVHLRHLTQELHHRQEVIGKQLSHVESRLRMHHHHHQQAHSESYRQLQRVHRQLQLQRTQLIRQQLAQESVVGYLREALMQRQQHHFGLQDDVKQEVARPFRQSLWWF